MSRLFVFLSWIIVVLTFPLSIAFCMKINREYERAVVFRVGRLRSAHATGPGVFFLLPCVDTHKKIDMRVMSFDVPPQEILSKDSVTGAYSLTSPLKIKPLPRLQ